MMDCRRCHKTHYVILIVIATLIILPLLIYLIYLYMTRSAPVHALPKTIERPHIILILADDMGFNDVSLHGSNQIPTPNIDSLAYHGQTLHRFYAQSICTPSRAALLTGNYPIRCGLQGSPIAAGENRSLSLDMPILSEHLKKLGYATHLVGKWHLGDAYRDVTPTRRGFDTHFGYWNGFIGYFDHEAFQEIENGEDYHGYDFVDNFTSRYDLRGKYATDLFTERALQLINSHQPDDAPLFLYLSHLAGHTGSNGTELGVPNVRLARKKYSYIENADRQLYAELINLMDESVGKVLIKLAEKKMLQNSIVAFISDNGAPTEGVYANHGSNWPFRGIKQTEFEGGVRVPAVIFSTHFRNSVVNRNLMHISDLMPTLYAAAGGDVEDLGDIDGVNQLGTLQSTEETKRKSVLLNINEKEGNEAIILGNYKLINGSYNDGKDDAYFGDDGHGPQVPKYDFSLIETSLVTLAIESLDQNSKFSEEQSLNIRNEVKIECNERNRTEITCKPVPCLFDLEEDPCETSDIYAAHEELAGKMLGMLEFYRSKLVAQLNRPVDKNANPKLYNNTWCPWLDGSFCKNRYLM